MPERSSYKMHMFKIHLFSKTKFLIGILSGMAMVSVIIGSIPFYLGSQLTIKVYLDVNYLIKNKFTVNLRDLHNLIPEAQLYENERIFKNAISCQYSCHERTKFTQCSCDSLCEISGDCCYDYWFYCKKNATINEAIKSETQCSVNKNQPKATRYSFENLKSSKPQDSTLILDENRLAKKIDEINKTKSLYASCGILTLPNNEDISIKLISLCAKNMEEETKSFFQFRQNQQLADELRYLTYDMTQISKYSKYKNVYEKLCVSNDLYVENYEQARKLLYLAYDSNTNLFYKNYFCARCNNITSQSIKIIEPTIKCPLEYDLELKRKLKKDFKIEKNAKNRDNEMSTSDIDFHTFKYESPCIFTYKMPTISDNDLNSDINYRKCISDNYLLKSDLVSFQQHDPHGSVKTSSFSELLKNAANSTLNSTANTDTVHSEEITGKLIKFYSNLCNLFLLPVNVNVTRKIYPIMYQDANFRNLYCFKSWLLVHGFSVDHLNETSFIHNFNQTWVYESNDYKLTINRYDIFKTQQLKTDLNEKNDLAEFTGINEDFRQLHKSYDQLSFILNGNYKKLENNRDVFVMTNTKKHHHHHHLAPKTVQAINLTNINTNDPIGQLIQHERRRSTFQQESISHNFTIKISLIFSTKLNQLSQYYDQYKKINLNDLTDDEKLFLFKQIISDIYVNKLIERYDLKDLLVLNDYYISLAYLPSDSHNDYRFSVNIYLLLKLNEPNLNNLNERLKAILILINNFFKRDLVFFKIYKETTVRKIELFNYFVLSNTALTRTKIISIDDIDDQFYCIHDSNDIEFYSSDELQVDYDDFIKNDLAVNINEPQGNLTTYEYRFMLTRLHLFDLNETSYFNEARYHRYSILFEKNLFKFQNKLHVRYCHMKKIQQTIFLSNLVAKSKFDCPAETNHLYLIKNFNENFKVIVHEGHVEVFDLHNNQSAKLNHLNVVLFKSGTELPLIEKTNNSLITIEYGHLLVCLDRNSDEFIDLMRLNQENSSKFHFWFDATDYDIIDEIIENFIEQLNNWENIFWSLFTCLIIVLLSYVHIKF